MFGRLYFIWKLSQFRQKYCRWFWTYSDNELVDAYIKYNNIDRLVVREEQEVPKMLNCALRWDYNNGHFSATCWHCNRPMETPHSRRECIKPMPDIKGVIRREEEMYQNLLKRARETLSKIDANTITGEYLCKLHHTYGFDPSIVEGVVGILPEHIHQEYQKAWKAHTATGKAGQKKVDTSKYVK